MPEGTYRDLVKRRGFVAFLCTQFLGALNDCTYKMVVSLLAVNTASGFAEGGKIIAVAAFIFNVPYFLFSGYAGYVADVFNKRKVLIVVKLFEIVAMSIAFVAFFSNSINIMLFVLFLMATQSAFFSPSKYGILPEMLPDKDLSRANALLEMTTFVAIVIGATLGGVMCQFWSDQLGRVGLVLILIAVSGALLSFRIGKVPDSGAMKSFHINPWSEIGVGIKHLSQNKPLLLTALGIAYFMFTAYLVQNDMILFGKEILGLNDFWVSMLSASLAIGIAVGSLLAGRLSGDKVELGLVPPGGIGISLFLICLTFSGNAGWVAVLLTFLAMSAGLYIVPLNAFLQQKSPWQEKGRLIASSNFISTCALLLSSALLGLLRSGLDIPANWILLILGMLTLAVTAGLLKLLPDFLIRFVLWMVTHTIYRIRIVGREHIPLSGPALLVCNHVAHVDGLIVGSCIQRFVRFLVFEGYYNHWAFHRLLRMMKAISISNQHPREALRALDNAREELEQGHVVCIFVEGAVTRTGNLHPIRRGYERIVEDLDVPIIPVHLDRLWGSIFSFEGGRFYWKLPRKIPYPVTVSFGEPLKATATAQDIRLALQILGAEAVDYRRSKTDLLQYRFLDTAKRQPFTFCMADSSGKNLNNIQTLAAGLMIARRIRSRFRDEAAIGVLLPASVGGALTNIGIHFSDKMPVNLNFTSGPEAMRNAVRQCDIQTVISSRRFMEKVDFDPLPGTVFLEDLMEGVSRTEKLFTAVVAFLIPKVIVRACWFPSRKKPYDPATILFSSGTTGDPKGIVLSHHNILSNVEGFIQLFDVDRQDTMLGVLPFSHAFGLTGTFWCPLIHGFGAVYHPNPLDAKRIGKLAAQFQTTVLIATPSFYRLYIRKCTREQFESLRYTIVGAEKLDTKTRESCEEQFGLELLEGYGCTEMAPVVSVNIPDVVEEDLHQVGNKPGSVGLPIPGVAVKIVHPETFEHLPDGEQGLILARGPNRMLGYLNDPEKTDEVFYGEWYITGDVGSLDTDGFLFIQDRLSRFSKIGGEMVPHVRIENEISRLLEDGECAVTAIPDQERGERLVAFYTDENIQSETLYKQVADSSLPRLWVPKRTDFHRIEEIPRLPSGKLNLKQLKQLASDLQQ